MSTLTLLAETARDLMTAGPVSIAGRSTVDQAAAFLTSHGFGAAVVIDDAGHPLGVVTKTDVLTHARERADAGGHPAPAAVTTVMTPAVFSVTQDAPAKAVVGQFLALNVHHLFVTDAAGVVVGVISPLDVLRRLG